MSQVSMPSAFAAWSAWAKATSSSLPNTARTRSGHSGRPRIESHDERRDALRSSCDSILGRPEWPDRVRAVLGSEDEVAFAHADQAAKALGIDTWDIHWRRLHEKPADPRRWYHVMALCD